MDRRTFCKKTLQGLLGAGGAAVGLPLFFREGPAVFDPNDSHWSKIQNQANRGLDKDLEVDIAIIGGCYTGLSSAYHLAKAYPDRDIVVLEARNVGHGASGRNGGMVLPQTGAESFEIAEDLETHKFTYDMTVRSMRSMQQLVSDMGVDCDLVLDGYCHTINDPKDMDAYRAYVEQVRKVGMPLELWDQETTVQHLGTRAYAGAVFDPNGGHVHALKLVYALKQAAEAEGVTIYEYTPVASLEEGEKIRLVAGGRQVIARAVVLATNAYTSKLGYFKHRTFVLHVQCASTPPLGADRMASLGWRRRLPFFDAKDALYHVVLTPDHRLVVGGRSAEYFLNNGLHYKGNINKVSNIMLDELHRIYPSLKGIEFERVWNGPICMTFDGVEAVGVMGKYNNIFYGLGYNGHGVDMAFMFGDIIAHLYGRKEHDWERTAYYNHLPPLIPPEPYRWLGIQTTMKYVR